MIDSRYLDPEDEAFNEIERMSKAKKESVKAAMEKPRRTWVGLTDDDEIPWDGVDAKSFARAIEAKLKEKNT